ncbi:butyrate kinase [Lutispora sp.]|uniref:butyrate kinase n=1 Tax=Lutispora sp. TaxID=2828727 RepID=UPI002B2087D3|nr:butyrate kinase [Lutispora sp.]MEA4960895.1 butyrate kinase [Lutispora sp.]
MNQIYRILAINPGSTSTKIAVYDNEDSIFTKTIFHSSEIIGQFSKIHDQYNFRKEMVVNTLKEQGVDLNSLDGVVGRGGNMKPVKGGTYGINEKMIEDLKVGVMGQHASNLGGIIAWEIANLLNIPAYVVDPVVVDELEDLARISGMPEIPRKSKDHPLNQKAVGRKAAAELGGKYEEYNFLIAHLGGGISIGVHKKGRIIDVNNALDGDGPFSPERSGGLPVGSLVDMCFSGEYTKQEIMKKIVGNGGLTAYLGTNDGREIQKRIKAGDEYAKLIYEAMAYQISKEIGAGASVLRGEVDAILLTGGVAYDDEFTAWIKERVGFIAPVMVYPGEFEMVALVQGVLRVMNGVESVKIYS